MYSPLPFANASTYPVQLVALEPGGGGSAEAARERPRSRERRRGESIIAGVKMLSRPWQREERW